MDIYLDVVFLTNVLINYLILLVTSMFVRMKTSSLRMLLGALIGAAYVAVLIIFPGMKSYNSLIAKLILSLAIIAVTFSPEKIFEFFKLLAVFYVTTFIFAGAAFAFFYFNQSGGFVKNGIVFLSFDYLDYRWTTLFFSIIIGIIITRIFWELVQYRLSKEKLLIPLKIIVEKKTADLPALLDTGNSLHDPLTNMPVVIVEFMAIRELLPEEIQNIFKNSLEGDITKVTDIISNSSWFIRFRLIPFSSLGRENGMLIGFKPDYIELGEKDSKKDFSDVIIGICNMALSKNEKYRALIGPELT